MTSLILGPSYEKNTLTAILYLVFLFALVHCIHGGVNYKGTEILLDLTDVALRLMTPTGTGFDSTKRNFFDQACAVS